MLYVIPMAQLCYHNVGTILLMDSNLVPFYGDFNNYCLLYFIVYQVCILHSLLCIVTIHSSLSITFDF